PAAIGAKLGLQFQRPRSGPFAGPADPEAGPARRMQRPPADPAVAEDAVARSPPGDAQRGLQAKLLERPALRGGIARHLLELRPVVEGEGPEARPVALAVGGPVDLFQLRVVPEIGP